MALFQHNRGDEEEIYDPEEEEYDDGFDELRDEEAEDPAPEIRMEQRRKRFKLAVGAGNLAGVIGGTVLILVLLLLLTNMIYFVIQDLGRNFSLFQMNS